MQSKLAVYGLACSALLAGAPAFAAGPGPGDEEGNKPPLSFTLSNTLDFMSDIEGGRSQGSRLLEKLALAAAYDGADAGHEGLTGLILPRKSGRC